MRRYDVWLTRAGGPRAPASLEVRWCTASLFDRAGELPLDEAVWPAMLVALWRGESYEFVDDAVAVVAESDHDFAADALVAVTRMRAAPRLPDGWAALDPGFRNPRIAAVWLARGGPPAVSLTPALAAVTMEVVGQSVTASAYGAYTPWSPEDLTPCAVEARALSAAEWFGVSPREAAAAFNECAVIDRLESI